MAKMMVKHLSQIIGQEEEVNLQIEHVKSQILAAIQERIYPTTIASIEVPFTKEECWQTLKKLGKEKALGWDITMEFWLKFWKELANPCLSICCLH